MRWGLFLRVLFFVYCIEVGVFLVLAPWSSSWDRALLALPLPGSYEMWLHPLVRSLASAFGLLHLIWGAHDLDQYLGRRARQLKAPEPAPTEDPGAP